MSEAIVTYLHDHLAGSHFAIELLDLLSEQYRGDELGDFAVALNAEIKEDQEKLKRIIELVGSTRVDLAEITGWLGEKASQFKLRRDKSQRGVGTFEALEILTLGIRGKLALWQVLPIIREMDGRIPDFNYGNLAMRAHEQYARVEGQRRKTALATFSRTPVCSGCRGAEERC